MVNSHGEQVAANGLGNGPDVQGRVRAKSRGSFLSGVAIRVTRDPDLVSETANFIKLNPQFREFDNGHYD